MIIWAFKLIQTGKYKYKAIWLAVRILIKIIYSNIRMLFTIFFYEKVKTQLMEMRYFKSEFKS